MALLVFTSALDEYEQSGLCEFKMCQSLVYEHYFLKVCGVISIIPYSTQNIT
jgi:hypothetical protein